VSLSDGSSKNGSEKAVKWNSDALELVIIPGLENYFSSEAMDINDNGQIVGNFSATAFLLDNGTVTEMPTFNGTGSAWAISENGYVTGQSRVKGPGTVVHAYLWRDDIGMIDLGGLPVDNKKYVYNVGYDIIEDPDTNSNILYVVGESEYRAVLWTVDLTPLM